MKPAIPQLIGLLAEFGVRDLVCSPGSRNAALLLEADNTPGIRKHVVVDERSAAFQALGIAMVSQRPVALICTSGTALLNYAPAVAEAYYQGIPLIVISADRPLEWIDQDDSQTIRQPFALTNFTKASYDIDAERNEETYVWYVNRIVNEGLLQALAPKAGPVHFNVHLDGNVDEIQTSAPAPRKIDIATPPPRLSNDYINQLAARASQLKVMVVAGFMLPDSRLQKAFLRLSRLPNVSIMAETVSNLHLPQECYEVDTVLFPLSNQRDGISPEEIRPDMVISVGGALISRKLKEFLRKNPPKYHLSVSNATYLVDCFQSLTTKLDCAPAPFFSAFGKRLERLLGQHSKEENNAPFLSYRQAWEDICASYRKDFKGIPWCDLSALKMVFDALPKDTNLFLSNGTSVRYGQIIPYRLTHATYSNRGVSGIEGSTSTAVGASIVYPGESCLITGDMSFLYDLGGLVSAKNTDRLRIVVLDNGGGDIFRFIPATRTLPIREKYLSVAQDIPLENLAGSFGFQYLYADSKATLKRALKKLFHPYDGNIILHLDTRNCDNSSILTSFLNNHI